MSTRLVGPSDPRGSRPLLYTRVARMDKHFFLLADFFFIHLDVLEMNRLDKIARRSKRVGGAIADLWGPKKSPLFRMVKKCTSEGKG